MDARGNPVVTDRETLREAVAGDQPANQHAPKPMRGGLFRKFVTMFAAVVSLALITKSVSDFWFSYQEQQSLLIRIQHGQAQSAAEKIKQFLNEVTAGLAWQTQLTWTAETLPQWQFDAVRIFRQVPALTELMRLDAAGREQFRMSREASDVVMSGTDHSRSTAFNEAVSSKVYYGSIYFVDGSQPTMTVAIAGIRPEFGVIVAKVNLTFIWDVVSRIKVGNRGVTYVVDDVGRLIAHPDISLVLRATDMSRLPQVRGARTTREEPDTFPALQGVDVEGRSVLSSFVEVVPPGWLVFAELPMNEALAPLYDSALRSAALLLVALVLAFFAALFLAQRAIVPIRTLGHGAVQIGSGDLGKRISINTGDELEALGNEFNQMAARLQDSYATLERKVEERTRQLELANQAKSRFLATASHDLRQPLHALGLFIAQLRGRTNAEERRRVVAGIEAALAGMNELFNALLDISKLDAGVMKPNIADFALDTLFKRVEATFSGAACEKGLSLRIVSTGAWVRSDSILLERIVSNLVSNAIRYTPSGRVLVGCRRLANTVRIEVRDTGPGIPDHQQQNIFGEFYRLHNSGSDTGGLGLGLAIVDRLCRLLKHSIALTSAEGSGACFSVTLPAATASGRSAKPRSRGRMQARSAQEALIAVLDDDPLVLQSMSGLIRSWGCKVVTGSSDQALLDELAGYDRAPSMIISDYHLRSGKSGIEAIRHICSVMNAQIPALLMSGDTNIAPTQEARSNGYALLHKPVDPIILRDALSRLVKSPPPLSIPGHAQAVEEGRYRLPVSGD